MTLGNRARSTSGVPIYPPQHGNPAATTNSPTSQTSRISCRTHSKNSQFHSILAIALLFCHLRARGCWVKRAEDGRGAAEKSAQREEAADQGRGVIEEAEDEAGGRPGEALKSFASFLQIALLACGGVTARCPRTCRPFGREIRARRERDRK